MRLIFDYEHRLSPTKLYHSRFGELASLKRPNLQPRQVDLKRGPSSRLALHVYPAATVRNNAIDGGEPKSSSFPHLLGRKERLEEVLLGLCIHADARIDNCQTHVRTGLRPRMAPRKALVHLHRSSFKCKDSPCRHRVPGVGRQIQKDLSEFRAIRFDLPRLRIESNDQLDVFPNHGPQHLRHVLNHTLETQNLRGTNLSAAKGQHLTGQFLRSLPGTADFIKLCINLVVCT